MKVGNNVIEVKEDKIMQKLMDELQLASVPVLLGIK
jgi:hypothetical protein